MAPKTSKTRDTTTTARPTVRRERSEIYVAVGALEQAKKKLAAIAKKIEAMKGLQVALEMVDAEIATLSKRVTGLMAGTPQSGQAAAGKGDE